MTTPPGSTAGVARRLLLNGEAMRFEVEPAPPTGGGPKYNPFTSEQAREWLLPQIRSTRAGLRELPDELRAVDRIYIEAKLFPNYLAPTYYPEALLGYIGAVPVVQGRTPASCAQRRKLGRAGPADSSLQSMTQHSSGSNHLSMPPRALAAAPSRRSNRFDASRKSPRLR